MRNNKKQKDDAVDSHVYALTILFNNDQTKKYRFTNVRATTADAAVDKMKRYVACNGHFGNMSTDDVLNMLSAVEIEEI